MSDVDNTLTPAQAELFKDPAIEAAFQAWVAEARKGATAADRLRGALTRKQFLMRIRALIQSGAIEVARD